MYNYKTLKLAEMRKELMRTRARTEGEKMPYQRDKPHFTQKSAVPDAYRIRTGLAGEEHRIMTGQNHGNQGSRRNSGGRWRNFNARPSPSPSRLRVKVRPSLGSCAREREQMAQLGATDLPA